ncbi:MAG: menaquinone biosynthesis protein [Candidatus Rokubacteria bacterium]|nr:menaquinone biosynthesis protein [Candidatus Rokubacteria bacterium]
MVRVGRISYLNVEPFFHAFPWPVASALPPRALGEAVAEGRLDAGPLALADCIRLESAVARLPFGIATRDRAQSVFLFSSRPMAQLGGARIAVTGETATSVRLLRLLLTFRDDAEPARLVDLGEPADAVLLIGDAALRARHGAWPHPHCFDLGEEWSRWTGLPCVFAAWALRRDAGAAARASLGAVLDRSLEAGLRSLGAIARARRDVHEWGLSDDDIIAYLRGFSYRLGPEEEKAIAEFRRLLGLLDP